jgi:DNA invertase Pin-like site-specific DNA recombinase
MNSCPFKPNSQVAAYIRDSGYEEQEISAGEQEAAIRKYCAENNLVLSLIFTDAIPGKSTTGRDSFHDMIKHFRVKRCQINLKVLMV